MNPQKQHEDDVFEEGDEIPFFNEMAEVTDREVVEELPDDLPDRMEPAEYSEVMRDDDAKFVILKIDAPEGSADRWTANQLYAALGERFSEHGLPTVDAGTGGAGRSGRITAQTPATGSNPISAEDAESLAAFLRVNKDFEPLYALLGGVESEDDMVALSDAFGRAAAVREYAERHDG